MKKIFSVLLAVVVLGSAFVPVEVQAKSNYVYRQRANWVKVSKLSNKQLAGQQLSHPYSKVSVQQMADMMQSLNMNKQKLFKKGEFETSEIFTSIEARKYAPLLVKALEKVAPNEVVNMAIVHRRPYFIVRNDYISVLNVYATDQGVHFYFSKLMAKLSGDYQQASKVNESIRKAKSIRVSLESQPGQVLVADGKEVIFNPSYNFASANSEVVYNQMNGMIATDANMPKATRKQKRSKVAANSQLTPEPVMSGEDGLKGRLRQLEDLKKSGLITSSEYKQKRASILNDL